jgi:hypothetical protein
MWTIARSIDDLPGGIPDEIHNDPAYRNICAFIALYNRRHDFTELYPCFSIRYFIDSLTDSFPPSAIAYTDYCFDSDKLLELYDAMDKYNLGEYTFGCYGLRLNEFISVCPRLSADCEPIKPEPFVVLPPLFEPALESVRRKRGRPRKIVIDASY